MDCPGDLISVCVWQFSLSTDKQVLDGEVNEALSVHRALLEELANCEAPFIPMRVYLLFKRF